MAFEQPNNHLFNIGITSGSTFMNMLKVLLLLCIVIVIHVLFLPIYRWWKKQENGKFCRRLGKKLLRFFTFSIYTRYIIQAFITILLSSFSEMYELKIGGGFMTASYIMNYWILFISLYFYLFRSIVLIN